MKKRFNYNGLIGMFAMVVTFILMASFSPVIAGVSVAIVGAQIAGKTIATDVISDNVANLLRPEISKKITLMNPSRTLLNTVLNMITPVKAGSFEYKFYAVENRPFQDAVNGAYTGVSATSASIVVDNIGMWTINDTILVNGTTDGTDGHELVLYVYDKDIDADTLKVQAVNTTSYYVPNIANNAVLTRMGQGKYQLDAQTETFQMLPAETVQYMQIFMAQIEEGEYAGKYNKEVDYGYLDYAKQVIYDFKATQELSLLFGAKAKITDKKTGKEKWLTGGAVRSITNHLEYGAGSTDRTMTLDNITDWMKSNFAGNAGSQTKLVFCGSGFMANMMKLRTYTVTDESTAVTTTVDAVLRHLTGDEKTNFGVQLQPIKSTFGTWYLHYAALLDEAGWADNAIVLDPAHIEKAVFQPMRKRPIDLVGSGQSLAKAEVLEEICSIVVRYPDTHATIKPKA
jgi:hypothetical protein